MNHTSFLDYIEALLAFPGRRMFVLVGAKFYAWNPFLTFLLKAMGVIKVDEVTGNMDAVNKAVEQINKGHNILIFPENNQISLSTAADMLEIDYHSLALHRAVDDSCLTAAIFSAVFEKRIFKEFIIDTSKAR